MSQSALKVLVAVGSEGDAREVVRTGEKLASALGAQWEAIFVETSSDRHASGFEANEALAFAAQQGASVIRLSADTVAAGFARTWTRSLSSWS